MLDPKSIFLDINLTILEAYLITQIETLTQNKVKVMEVNFVPLSPDVVEAIRDHHKLKKE
jgi:hypothetical protein